MYGASRFAASLLATTLVGLALVAIAGCGSSGNRNSGSSKPQPKVSELVNLTGGPRVDLPGRVSILVQALDRNDDPVAGLTSSDFRLFENGSRVSPTESQQQLLPVPRVYRLLSFLLLDLSASISRDPEVLSAEIAAAKAYVNIVTRDPSHRVAVGFFFGVDEISPARIFDPATGGFEPLGFSGDRGRINEALDNVGLIEVLDDSTNLYGAVIEASQTLAQEAQALLDLEEVDFVSRALVTFTDGSHNANDLTLDAAAAALSQAGDAFTIGVGSEIDTRALERLGPKGAVTASRLSRLRARFEEIGEILSDQANSFYRVGYISPKNHGASRPVLRVEAENGAGVALFQSDFSPLYFSSGAGFLDATTSGAADVREGSCVAVDIDEADRTVALIHDSYDAGVVIGRFDRDGKPDTSFGNGGRIVFPVSRLRPGATLTPRDLSISRRDGRIHVVAEQTFVGPTSPNLVVIRVNDDDSLDFVELPAHLSGDSTLDDFANDIEADRDGRVWIAGASRGPGGSYRLVVRLTRGLELSSNFSDDGVVTHATDPSTPVDEAFDLVVDPSLDRVVTVGQGYSEARGGGDMQLVAFRDDGRVDNRFGTAGVVSNPVVFEGGLVGFGRGLAAIQDKVDDNIVVAGSVTLPGLNGPLERPALWRFQEDGTPEPSFVGGFSNPFAPGNPYATAGVVSLGDVLTGNEAVFFSQGAALETLMISSERELLAAGTRMNAAGHEDAFWLSVDMQGRLRSEFNGTGFLIEDGSIFDGGNEAISSVDLRGDEAVVSCGETSRDYSSAPRPLVIVDDDPRRR